MSVSIVISLISIAISAATIVLNIIMDIRLRRREEDLERSMFAPPRAEPSQGDRTPVLESDLQKL